MNDVIGREKEGGKRRSHKRRSSKRKTIKRRKVRSMKRERTKSTTYIEYDLFNGLKWDNYRLGDVIYGNFACWDNVCLDKNNPNLDHTCDDMDFEVNKEWCEGYKDVWTDPKNSNASYIQSLHKNFPGSIASKYVKAVGYPKAYKMGDHATIKQIFSKFKYKKPSHSTLVIHLRLGDTITGDYGKEYSHNLKYYENLLKKVRRNKKIKKVDIVTGLHINVYVKESNKRLNEIVHMFEKFYPVEVILTKNPDKDFYYMSHSKFFANSGGGFSLLVTEYLKQDKKNKVYENK